MPLSLWTDDNNVYFSFAADCLESFTDIEELEETELYMCHGCKQRQRSTKKFWIRSLPNVSLLLCYITSLETMVAG